MRTVRRFAWIDFGLNIEFCGLVVGIGVVVLSGLLFLRIFQDVFFELDDLVEILHYEVTEAIVFLTPFQKLVLYLLNVKFLALQHSFHLCKDTKIALELFFHLELLLFQTLYFLVQAFAFALVVLLLVKLHLLEAADSLENVLSNRVFEFLLEVQVVVQS